GALKGMIRSLGDPYSIFLDPEETENFTQELSGSFEGIGAEIGIKNDQLTVIAALPNTPAYNAGLKAGDKILKINDFDTIDMSLDMAVSLIRGPQETVVVLTILSSNNDEINEISITRNIIDVESVTWEILDDNIAYIELIHFNSDTYSDFKKIANEIILKNPNGIVLDLRSNPGGYLDNAIDVAGEFLEDKVIVIEDFGDSREEYKSGNNAKLKDIPMVVLVDAGSASASEIVAGAMQDYDRATIVGEMTFGKGSVQDFEEYIDGSSLKITVAKWLTPNGISIEDEGIIPDVEIINTEEDFNNNQDPQLDKALEILKQ
ncbi:S41 family peptidase, partial [Patescibacteria group bacterium]|nr:S41 family peptidase [Patescibacteria group bacterium]